MFRKKAEKERLVMLCSALRLMKQELYPDGGNGLAGIDKARYNLLGTAMSALEKEAGVSLNMREMTNAIHNAQRSEIAKKLLNQVYGLAEADTTERKTGE